MLSSLHIAAESGNEELVNKELLKFDVDVKDAVRYLLGFE
jgi:hypothetical protein